MSEWKNEILDEYRNRLRDAIAAGNLKALKEIRDQRMEDLKGKVIFADENEDGTISVIAICLGWVHEKIKTLTPGQYEELIEKYQFEDLFFPFVTSTACPVVTPEPDELSTFHKMECNQ